VLATLSEITKGLCLDDEVSNEKNRRHSSRRGRGQSKALAPPTLVVADSKPFRDMGVQVPATLAAAIELAGKILDDQKDVLKVGGHCFLEHRRLLTFLRLAAFLGDHPHTNPPASD